MILSVMRETVPFIYIIICLCLSDLIELLELRDRPNGQKEIALPSKIANFAELTIYFKEYSECFRAEDFATIKYFQLYFVSIFSRNT